MDLVQLEPCLPPPPREFSTIFPKWSNVFRDTHGRRMCSQLPFTSVIKKEQLLAHSYLSLLRFFSLFCQLTHACIVQSAQIGWFVYQVKPGAPKLCAQEKLIVLLFRPLSSVKHGVAVRHLSGDHGEDPWSASRRPQVLSADHWLQKGEDPDAAGLARSLCPPKLY